MRKTVGKLNESAKRLIRRRFAFPVILILAAALLLVSELTHRALTSTLGNGIKLTDVRLQSQHLLQLVTEADKAQFAYLVTGQQQYLQRLQTVSNELPEVARAVSSFFSAQSPDAAESARHLVALTNAKLAHIDAVTKLATAGQLAEARDLVRSQPDDPEMTALRQELIAQLARAASLQEAARTSIYGGLLINRVAVGSLTVVSLLMFFLFLHELKLQDRQREEQDAALTEERERLEVEVNQRTARLAELATYLQTVREDERAYIARELHDELGGLLTVCKLEIARARTKTGEPATMLIRLERMNEYLNKGIALKRRIIEDLRPSTLSELGLSVALYNLCQDMQASLGVPVSLSSADFALSQQASLAVYRFVQEALTNIGKYARATRVEVLLSVAGDHAVVEVHDDGQGFDPETPRIGLHGLSGMQFRAESMGGSMQIRSAPGKGTAVRIEFPQSAVTAVVPVTTDLAEPAASKSG